MRDGRLERGAGRASYSARQSAERTQTTYAKTFGAMSFDAIFHLLRAFVVVLEAIATARGEEVNVVRHGGVRRATTHFLYLLPHAGTKQAYARSSSSAPTHLPFALRWYLSPPGTLNVFVHPRFGHLYGRFVGSLSPDCSASSPSPTVDGAADGLPEEPATGCGCDGG